MSKVTTTAPSRRAQPRTGEPDAVGSYLNAIGAIPLLSATEEVELAKRIEAGVYAAELLRRADAGEQEPARDRRDLAAVVRDGERARSHMIQANLRLVVAAARKRRDHMLPLGDLIQEGNLGLIHAVEKFDYTKGYKFSTYAMWWIRQAIQRGVAFGGRTIRLPEHTNDQLLKLERVEAALRRDLDHEPTVAELAEAASLPVARVSELRDVGRVAASLDTPVGDDGDTDLGELLGDIEADPVGEAIERQASAARLAEVLDSLPPLAKKVLTLRYGLYDGRERTLKDTAEHAGVTRAQARRLEEEALARLREPEQRRSLLALAG
ncbi:sigma-70 family RNA polymerase sigma factor [Amycolatopsis rhizosphaerae]|uniref:RNA polymerase sigma factor n=1 Tax=Amycolatopsis rhizosphaerae TaxID=2053003 RepID=A0A558D5K1_9PSEU|nr:sigma-70 family RNA polymerase sigma factor [Amycolatopsis rhizosphaerae]TVT56294.1 sigma-70 family RNA polymerase sigma factor [Amycolatopsis rhizosphaerae]